MNSQVVLIECLSCWRILLRNFNNAVRKGKNVVSNLLFYNHWPLIDKNYFEGLSSFIRYYRLKWSLYKKKLWSTKEELNEDLTHSYSTYDEEKVTNKWSKKVSSKFGVCKFLVLSEILAHSYNFPIFGCANRDF